MTSVGRFLLDGASQTYQPGDTIAVAVARGGQHPGHGGTLCLAGDCGNCLGVVDGVAYVRTCQVEARHGMVVERHPADGNPRLPLDAGRPDVDVVRSFVERVIVGAGGLDAANGDDVVGIFSGPTVIARTPTGMLHVEAEEVIVATGAAELQPVVPGNDLHGIYTPRAARRLGDAGVGVVFSAEAPAGVAELTSAVF